MKILVASDEKTELTDSIVNYLEEKGHKVALAGHLSDENMKWHWAEIARNTAQAQIDGRSDLSILLCWSGTGVCIAANKIPGVRAALCWDKDTAELSRKWDDANILCLSLKFTTPDLAKEIIDAFINTSFDEEDLDQVSKIE